MNTTENTPQNKLSSFSREELLAALEHKDNVQENNRKAYKELVEESIPGIVEGLVSTSETLSKIKTQVFASFEEMLQLKAEVYSIKEEQRSHTFTTDTHSITIGFRINDNWDDTVKTGIAKVKEFINSLAKDEATGVLVNTVLKLLQKNKKGDLQANKVLELKAMAEEFKNDLFTDGVDIILKSYKPARGNWFIEAYEVYEGNKTAIPLSLAAVDFEPGYEFNFYKDDKQPKEQTND